MIWKRVTARKEPLFGLGTRVHFTQTCDEDAPPLITHVETTQAPIPDEHSLSAIHTDLAEKKLLPDQHLVDAGYVTIDSLMKTQSGYGVNEGPPYSQDALVSSRDRLRSHAFLNQLGRRDCYVPTRPDQFKLDTGPGCGQIVDQGQIFSERL